MAIIVPETREAFFRLATLKGALKLEIIGLSRSKGETAHQILKRMGYKGTKEEVLDQVTNDVEEAIGSGKEDQADVEEVVELHVAREARRHARQVLKSHPGGDDAA